MPLDSPIISSDLQGVKWAKLQRFLRQSIDNAGISYTMSGLLSDIQPSDTEGVKWAKLGAWMQLLANNIGGSGGGGDLLAANNLSDVASAGTSRTNLGLGTAATQATGAFDAAGAAAAAQAASQPFDSDLTAIAALTTTAFGRAVLALANAGALATYAGVGPGDSPTFAGVTAPTITGGASGLTLAAGGSNQNIIASPSGTGVFQLRNGTNYQRLSVYETYTDASNYRRLDIESNTFQFRIISTGAGTGTIQELYIGTNGNNASLRLLTNNLSRWVVDGAAGHLLAGSDNAYDIGASGATRPRNLWLGGTASIGGTSAVTGIRTAVATLNFASILADGYEDLTITVTGAAVGMAVIKGLPTVVVAGADIEMWVSAADTVTVRCNNVGAVSIDPASASYRATVISF